MERSTGTQLKGQCLAYYNFGGSKTNDIIVADDLLGIQRLTWPGFMFELQCENLLRRSWNQAFRKENLNIRNGESWKRKGTGKGT